MILYVLFAQRICDDEQYEPEPLEVYDDIIKIKEKT